jgi:hypothetical protein
VTDPALPPAGFAFRGVERLSVAVAREAAGPFADRDDFLKRGIARITEDFDVWELPSHPPTGFALMSALRRRGGDLRSFAQAVMALPDVRLIRRLVLVGGHWRERPWIRQTSGRSVALEAEVFPETGDIWIYRLPADEGRFAQLLAHEWSHLLLLASPVELSRLGDAEMVEPIEPGQLLKEPAGPWMKLQNEYWSAIGERLLCDPMLAATSAAIFPIHTTLYLSALARRLRSLPKDVRGPRFDRHRGLVSGDLMRYARGLAADRAGGAMHAEGALRRDAAARLREALDQPEPTVPP